MTKQASTTIKLLIKIANGGQAIQSPDSLKLTYFFLAPAFVVFAAFLAANLACCFSSSILVR
jgi:hypothetical protein